MSDRPELCVGAVAVQDDHLLMIRRGTPPGLGLWSLPGGRVERGELMLEAVVREVGEETGLDVVCEGMMEVVERIGPDWHFVIANHRVTVVDEAEPNAGTDAAEAAWIPLVQVGEMALTDGLAAFLADHGLIDTWVGD